MPKPIMYHRVVAQGTALVAGLLILVTAGYFLAKQRFEIDPEDIKAVGAISAALFAAGWVVLYAVYTGAPAFELLRLEKERENYIQRIELDMSVAALTPVSGPDDIARVPLSIYAVARNGGTKSVRDLDYEKPLLLLARFASGDASTPVFDSLIALPYVKLHTPTKNASIQQGRYRKGGLQPGDAEHYAFLHPGVLPGIYLVQFQLVLPEGAVPRAAPGAIWVRMMYVEVTAAGKVLQPLPAGRSSSPETKGS
jgi:hypothetical protein